ncbi:TonB-dependent receptor plug domain-containing protein [Sedimenticola selenatireducens]|uniref:Outer membrane beta-barrel protein n=1 Tax=Sedimenticola selenatireducens TaxID=191960 RepID=A0A558DX74_9GAMM|nr:TonB-dependent receptor [Sedimenticola selenatireducens]TVO70764.1 outer membrane beta-barrel protein [Sedimenticola selenatireducens]TVT65684.1 MAG: outer membrane beta-barrel protein [Sedimenticola selenatireducens]
MKYHRFPLKRTVLATLATALAQGVIAEETVLPSITVTAEPLQKEQTINSTKVDANTLQSLRPATSDAASLLKNIPGVNLYGAGGVSSLPVIHGLADDRLRIKVDGMDLISACGNHMNPPLSYIDPTSVGSAEVFAGITPVSVGGDSIGGAILVDSADPEFAQAGEGLLQKGEVGAFYRSNGDAHGGNLSATIANEKISLTYRGSTAQSDDYKAGDDFKPAGLAAAGRGWLDGDEVGSSMYKSTNHSLALAMRHENHLMELKLGLQDIPYQGWPNQRMDMTGNDSTQVNLRYEGEFDWGGLEARAYREHTRHVMQFGEDKLFWYGSNSGVPFTDGVPCTPTAGMNGCAAGMPMDTEGKNSGLVVKADLPLSERDLLRVGGEAQRYRLDDWWDPSGKGMWPNTFWNINNGERDRLAAFAEWEAQWNPKWLTQFGLRYEKVDMNAGDVQGYNTTSAQYAAESAAFNAADREKTDHNIDLTALARLTLDDTRSLEFGYARKTRSPNLYERYTWSTGGMAMRMINMAGDGNGYVGNLNLEPEVAHTLSATFDWHDPAQDKWGLKLTPYYTYVNDYIDAQRCASANSNCGAANQTDTNAFVYLQFVNQSAHMYGLDVSGHYPLAENTSYGDFTATGVLSYVRGKNRTTDDNLYNIMPLNAKLAVVQSTGHWKNTLEVELVDGKDDVSQVRNELETKSYGLLHLRSRYEWKQVGIDFGIENVFDKFYNHPLGGAYTGQGKTMSGTDVPWGVPVPGAGRSIYAGVNYKF